MPPNYLTDVLTAPHCRDCYALSLSLTPFALSFHPSISVSLTTAIAALPLTSMGAGVELAVARPKCNSILHVFHEWLFEAAHIGGDTWRQNRKSEFRYL